MPEPVLQPVNLPRPGGRMPPRDLQSEGIVLAHVVLNPTDFEKVAFLRPEHFFSDANRYIFDAIGSLIESGDPLDLPAVATRLRDQGRLDQVGGSPYLYELVSGMPATVHPEASAQQVFDRWRLREAIAIGQRTAAEGYTGPGDVQAFIEQVESSVSALAQLDRVTGLQTAAAIVGAELDRFEQQQASGEAITTGSPIGLLGLDQLTGGWHATDLTILAARPGIGKTSLATTVVAETARVRSVDLPIGVAFFSLEMGREQIALRFACSEARLDVSAIRRNKLEREQLTALRTVHERLVRMPIWIDDTPAITLMMLRSRVRKLKAEIAAGKSEIAAQKLGLVVVDYLQLMRGLRSRGDSREQEVSSISQGLKRLAKQEQIAVLALSQLNRNIEYRGKRDDRPKLSDLRESGSLEQDADNVWMLHKPAATDDSASQNETHVYVEKQRNGPTGIVKLYFEALCTRFFPLVSDAPPDNYDDLDNYIPPM